MKFNAERLSRDFSMLVKPLSVKFSFLKLLKIDFD